jgi:hypothetical protein
MKRIMILMAVATFMLAAGVQARAFYDNAGNWYYTNGIYLYCATTGEIVGYFVGDFLYSQSGRCLGYMSGDTFIAND